MPETLDPTTAIDSATPVRTDQTFVPPPKDEARQVVNAVLRHALDEPRERRVFETPGVIEALDEALHEVDALRQQHGGIAP